MKVKKKLVIEISVEKFLEINDELVEIKGDEYPLMTEFFDNIGIKGKLQGWNDSWEDD